MKPMERLLESSVGNVSIRFDLASSFAPCQKKSGRPRERPSYINAGGKNCSFSNFSPLLHHNRRKLFVFHTQKTYATIIPQLYLERGLPSLQKHMKVVWKKLYATSIERGLPSPQSSMIVVWRKLLRDIHKLETTISVSFF